MDDDGGVPGQKRSLEPNDDESAAPVTDGDRKKLKTDDCQFCSFDNKLPKLKDPQQWSSLPSVVHEVLAMIWSRKKRLDPAHDGAEKQQQHRENDADNIKEEPTILPNQNNEKEVVNNITENESTKKKNECILIGNEKPNIVFPKNVEIHVLESLKSNIVEILDNYDNSPDKANNVEEKNETLNIPITLVEHIDNDCVLKPKPKEHESGFTDKANNVEVINTTLNTSIALVPNTGTDIVLRDMPMEIDRDISDNECNIEVINNTLNTQITLVENIEEDVVQKAIPKKVEDCFTDKANNVEVISHTLNTLKNVKNINHTPITFVENTEKDVVHKVKPKDVKENKFMHKKFTSENIISSEPAKDGNKYMTKKSISENIISSEPAKVRNKCMSKKSSYENIASEPAKVSNTSTSTKNISTHSNSENIISKLDKLLSLSKRSQLLEISIKLCSNGILEVPTTKPSRCICMYCKYVNNIPVEHSAVHYFIPNNSNLKHKTPKNKILHRDMYSSNITVSDCPTCASKGIYTTNDCSCVGQSNSKMAWIQDLKSLIKQNEKKFEAPKTINVSNSTSTSFASIKGVVNKVYKATERIKSHLPFCNNCKTSSNHSRKYNCKCSNLLSKKDKYNIISDKYHYKGGYRETYKRY